MRAPVLAPCHCGLMAGTCSCASEPSRVRVPACASHESGQGDRVLLERAAKAVGLRVQWAGIGAGLQGWIRLSDSGIDVDSWNPLIDDGDALRLARSCGIGVAWMKVYIAGSNPMIEVEIADPSDPASVRRAIVECAARRT